MDYLIVLNDAPHASERDWNALRLAKSLAGGPGTTVRLFLLGEGVVAATAGQTVPQGGHDVEAAVREFAAGNEVAACKTCMEARDLTEADLVQGARVGTLMELSAWTALSDKVLIF